MDLTYAETADLVALIKMEMSNVYVPTNIMGHIVKLVCYINTDQGCPVLEGKLSIIIEIFNFSTYIDKCLEDDGLYKCLNGGTCFVDDTGHANCKCFDQYEGSICEHGKSYTSY